MLILPPLRSGTQTICNLRRGGDNVTADFTVATSGDIGLSCIPVGWTAEITVLHSVRSRLMAAAIGTLCTLIHSMIRPAAVNDLTQVTTANQPELLLNIFGGKPVMSLSMLVQYLCNTVIA